MQAEPDEPEDHPASSKYYLPASETQYLSHVQLQTVTPAASQVFEDTLLQCVIDDAVKSKVVSPFEEAHEKALTGSFTPLFQVVEQTAAKVIYLGGVNEIINNKLEKHAE